MSFRPVKLLKAKIILTVFGGSRTITKTIFYRNYCLIEMEQFESVSPPPPGIMRDLIFFFLKISRII